MAWHLVSGGIRPPGSATRAGQPGAQDTSLSPPSRPRNGAVAAMTPVAVTSIQSARLCGALTEPGGSERSTSVTRVSDVQALAALPSPHPQERKTGSLRAPPGSFSPRAPRDVSTVPCHLGTNRQPETSHFPPSSGWQLSLPHERLVTTWRERPSPSRAQNATKRMEGMGGLPSGN